MERYAGGLTLPTHLARFPLTDQDQPRTGEPVEISKLPDDLPAVRSGRCHGDGIADASKHHRALRHVPAFPERNSPPGVIVTSPESLLPNGT